MTDTNYKHRTKIIFTGLLFMLTATASASSLPASAQTHNATQQLPATQADKQHQASRPRSLPKDDFFYNAPYDARAWNPYEEIQRMQRDMDRMFNNTYSRFNASPDFQNNFRGSFITPKMDVQENDLQYTVIVDLPGASKDNISVNLEGQVLTIEGKQNFEKENKDGSGNVIFQERRSGSFQRSLTLPGPVKQAGMKTKVDNGVLTIIIQKDV